MAAVLLGFADQSAHAAATEAKLVLASEAARPGDTVMAGVHLRMQPTWHIYWRNPGGAGMPTKIAWQLPPGITAGEIQWPIPQKLPAEELTTYVYDHEVTLLVPLKIAADAKPGPLDLKAKISWLECATQCIPGSGDVQAVLTIGNETKPSSDAPLIETWQKKLPSAKPDLAARAFWDGPAKGDTRNLIFEWPAASAVKEADFYPYGSDKFDVQWQSQFKLTDSLIRLQKTVKKYEGDWPTKIAGLLIQKSDGATSAYDVNLPVNEPAVAQPVTATSPALPRPAANADSPSPLPSSLLEMLFYAFLGGMILNVMPCVLPVIALKILGFVNQAKEDPTEVRKLGLVYTSGVLVSFLALAALVIIVKSLGHAASWGMQFQNPQFLIVMTVLVTLVALNLFGIFEINLNGRIMGGAGNLASREGYGGAFLNGVLATILATPCTAPFLGVALGFAFTQPSYIIVLIFLTVGLGLAAPYVILSWEPAWLKFLPKPGAWMEKFKIAMGFPMLATAIWMFTLVTANFGDNGDLSLGLFLVLVGFAAWVWGQFVQRGRTRRGLAMAFSLGILVVAYSIFLERQLDWRHPMPVSRGSLRTSLEGIDWQPWSPEALATARQTGRPILVDFTAKWCAVCQVNLRTSLEVPSVRAKLKQINAIAFEENSFTKDPTVVAELTRYQRAGVPLILVYSGNPALPPQVLPDGYLTPGIVLNALGKAEQQTVAHLSASNR
ncbi:MAG: cytochrome c biosis protein transrane region [Pedosphaera sp.]|nr:cytochrome c biosis protein transrane region [Pedosphaera sp.]